MRVTINQLKTGMIGYLKNEIQPNLPQDGFAGFGVAFLGALAVGHVDKFLINMQRNPLFSMFEIVDENGTVDLDVLAEALAFAMPETGLPVPIGKMQKITFRSGDAQKLCEYIAK